MKLLYITNYPAPYRVDLFNELGKYCDLTVTFEEHPEEQTHRDYSWFNLDYQNFRPIYLKRLKIKKHLNICYEILSVLKEKFDFIIVGIYSSLTSIIAMEYMKVNKIPYIIQTDGGIIKNGKSLIEKLKKKLISSADYWLSPSLTSDDYFYYYGASREKIFRYPFTSINLEEIITKPISNVEKQMTKEKLCVREEKMIVSVGQFIHRKGFDVLLEAVSNMAENSFGFYIIGGEPTEEYLQYKEKYNLDNVHFVGFKSKKELLSYYLAADLFVLPTREDIWGLVINEAMAYGLPVITTDTCVAGLELVAKIDQKDCIVPSEDPAALGLAIEKLFNSPDKMVEISSRNLQTAKEYSIQAEAKSYIRTLESIKI
ncbi:glycosyltransferase family 4 protein [Priestia megaterium]|uniref:glycosyltransferase family 4 protein n=1 Tax=Priestia megaterium TaxID=1404 RepID=UPI00324223AE